MISASLLLLLGVAGALIAAVVGIVAVIFLVLFKKGLNLPITTKDNPPDQTPS